MQALAQWSGGNGIPFYIVDIFQYAGIAGGLQCITHIYMAGYMATFKSLENKSVSDASIAGVFIYIIYPTRIRSDCYAVNMMLHWIFRFAVVLITPSMFVALSIWGAYVFWACICAVGLGGLWLLAPETKGVPMKKMEELFSGPWWMGWEAKADEDVYNETLPKKDDLFVDDKPSGRTVEGRQEICSKLLLWTCGSMSIETITTFAHCGCSEAYK
ncbi:putative General substrate transporter [Seiridium unicorne]|uniref:General substrate transporter n=1 Tax=Seiridium unicorne TaxID=138068 RepID=A0ABR2UMV7_9PEZI